MIYPPDHRSAMRAALREERSGDAIRLAILPLRVVVYRGRRKLRRPVAPPCQALPAAAATSVMTDDERAIVARASASFRITPPPSSEDTSMFRAAGARRLPVPVGSAPFADLQDGCAWHRLYWMLESVGPTTQAQLRDWLRTPPDALVSHPYNTSERIRTIAELLGTLGAALDSDTRLQLIARLRADAAWLASHVEHHLGVQNHLLNNARALYAASLLLAGEPAAERWRDEARALWDTLWPQLILDDGVFAEQSTHYHVLLTRTLLEYVHEACVSGRRLPAGMFERAGAMCRVTNLLVRPDGTLPLFGNISPDHPTEWLRGIPLACERAGLLDERVRDRSDGYAGGASALFRNGAARRSRDAMPTPEVKTAEWTTRLFPHGGVFVAAHGALGIELVAHGDPRARTACHGDTGRGSFEIWTRGRRVVVDGGVPSYQPSVLRDSLRGAPGQNGIAVDGLPPAILADACGDLPDWYLTSIGGGSWDVTSTAATFRWRGFGRYRPGLVWRRTWRWSEATITVEDVLEGWMGEATIECFLHFGERGWRASTSHEFTLPGALVRVGAPEMLVAHLAEMPHCTDYGAVVAGQGVHVHGRVRVPVRWHTTITITGEG